MKNTVLLAILTLCECSSLSAQVNMHQITIVTKEGIRIRGYLYDVTNTDLVYSSSKKITGNSLGTKSVSLQDIRFVNVYGGNNREMVIEGAVLGGAGLTYVTNRAHQAFPLRSPVMSGITLALAFGAGAGVGSFLGTICSDAGRRGIKFIKKQGGEQLLRRELAPLTYVHRFPMADYYAKGLSNTDPY